jgi:hypothetical protein
MQISPHAGIQGSKRDAGRKMRDECGDQLDISKRLTWVNEKNQRSLSYECGIYVEFASVLDRNATLLR